MKKIILSAMMVFSIAGIAQQKNAESKEKTHVLGVTGELAVNGTVALTYEDHEKGKLLGKNFSTVYTFGYATAIGTNTDTYGLETNHYGSGFTGGLGIKMYLNNVKEFRGWNIQNNLYGSTYRFTDESYKGKFSSISFLNPTIGYKFRSGSTTYIEPQLGVAWDIITNSSGVADSFDSNKFSVKIGMRIGFGV